MQGYHPEQADMLPAEELLHPMNYLDRHSDSYIGSAVAAAAEVAAYKAVLPALFAKMQENFLSAEPGFATPHFVEMPEPGPAGRFGQMN